MSIEVAIWVLRLLFVFLLFGSVTLGLTAVTAAMRGHQQDKDKKNGTL